jgi:hypothetical protein
MQYLMGTLNLLMVYVILCIDSITIMEILVGIYMGLLYILFSEEYHLFFATSFEYLNVIILFPSIIKI